MADESAINKVLTSQTRSSTNDVAFITLSSGKQNLRRLSITYKEVYLINVDFIQSFAPWQDRRWTPMPERDFLAAENGGVILVIGHENGVSGTASKICKNNRY